MRADELVDQLHEGSAVYAGRSAAAAGRLRASVLAEFAEVGLPAAAVPYVVEVLRTELNPEVVAAAALAVRGWPGSDPEPRRGVGPGRGQSPGSRRAGRPRGRRGPRWSRCSPRWPGSPRLRRRLLAAPGAAGPGERPGLEPGGPSGAGRHLGGLAGADRARDRCLVGRGWPVRRLPNPPSGRPRVILVGVVVEDQDGVRQPLIDFLSRADTVVAFFYTRCQNPNKCSLTITKLADLQARMLERGMAGQLAAISYDPVSICRPDWPRTVGPGGCISAIRFECSGPLRAMPRLAEFFGLRVGYTGTIVNQHGLELFLVDSGCGSCRPGPAFPGRSRTLLRLSARCPGLALRPEPRFASSPRSLPSNLQTKT